MADDLKFTHISVTPDEDEDIVIQAGASPAASNGPARASEEKPAQAPVPQLERASAAEPAQESSPAPQRSPAPQPEQEPASAPASKREPAKKPEKKDDYHETTLEDIESVKMSSTQKVVIAVAVVGIIVFVAYYVMNFVL